MSLSAGNKGALKQKLPRLFCRGSEKEKRP
jgi:hypothetical protein